MNDKTKEIVRSAFTQTTHGDITIITHKVTGDTFVCNPASGNSLDQGEFWMDNYYLPVVVLLKTGMFPMEGFQMSSKRVAVSELANTRLKSYIGNDDLAHAAGLWLERDMQFNQEFVKIGTNQSMLVLNYRGPHITGFPKQLPRGAVFDTYIWRILSAQPDFNIGEETVL